MNIYLRTVTKVKMPNIESENLELILRGDLCSGTETKQVNKPANIMLYAFYQLYFS